MSGYAVAHLDEIGEITDGREPSRPVRAHFGITSFGVNAWTAKQAGDRIINEHDESVEGGGQEELYLVHTGRARFELDGDRVDAPAGSLVFVERGVKRTAFAEEPGTTLIALGGTPGEVYEPSGYEFWAPVAPLYQAGEYAEAAAKGREVLVAHPEFPVLVYNVACCEASRGRQPRRSNTSAWQSSARNGSASSPRATPTSILFATTPRSRSWWVSC